MLGRGRVRRALRAAFVCALAVACRAESSAPAALHGSWVSDDARYAGRSLEIGSHVVRFLDGNSELDAIVVRSVAHEGEGEALERFVIDGSARDGSPVRLAIGLRTRPVEELQLETSTAVWHREPDGGLR